MARVTKKNKSVKRPAQPAGEDAPSLKLETRTTRNRLLVTPHGRMGEIEAHQLQRELLALIDQGAQRMVVDMTDVPFITSTCLGALMVAHKRIREKNGYIRVAGAQPLVRQILEITKLVKLFGRYETPAQALAEE